jgi:iron(III) transport system substrate-binding protein
MSPLWKRLSGVLACLTLAVACTAPAAPSNAAGVPATARGAGAGERQSAPAASDPERAQLVEAAKREGKLNIAAPRGDVNRHAIMQFATAYPGIEVEYVGFQGPDFGPRVLAERQGGLYAWDIYVGGTNTAVGVLKSNGVLDPLRPAIRPELQQDHLWYGGFEYGFTDIEKQYVYMVQADTTPPVFVNREFVSKEEFDSPRQLLDPRWKGRIAIQDPRGAGPASRQLASLISAYGEEFGRRLLVDQAPVIGETRQNMDWLVRGRYPLVALAQVTGWSLVPFKQQGLGLRVEAVGAPEVMIVASGSGCLALINQAPHPNAARLFIDWFMSKEGQEHWIAAESNSRRTDVPIVAPDEFPDPKLLSQMQRNDEAWEPVRERAVQLARELLGS